MGSTEEVNKWQIVSCYHVTFLFFPTLGLNTDTSAASLLVPSKKFKEFIELNVQAKVGASSTNATTAPPTTSDITKSGKVGNYGAPSISPKAGQHIDSQAFSSGLEKLRMIYEKCPVCLLPH